MAWAPLPPRCASDEGDLAAEPSRHPYFASADTWARAGFHARTNLIGDEHGSRYGGTKILVLSILSKRTRSGLALRPEALDPRLEDAGDILNQIL